MRTCVSCGESIPEKKRKDAKYCDKPGCRGREYRKRQAEAQAAEGKAHAHAASTVLACACGRRYRIQISAIEGPEVTAERALSLPEPPATAVTETVSPTAPAAYDMDDDAERVAEAAEAFTETVSPTAQPAPAADTGPALEAGAAAAVTQAVLLTDQQADEPPSPPQPTAMDDTQALTETDRSEARSSGFVTLELYFLRGEKHRLSLNRAVNRRRDGRWTLQPQTRAAFSVGEVNRPSLGGKPGAWERFYAGRSPVDFGYEPDLVVMFWDQKERRGRVAQTSLLRDILGDGWKAKLREQAGGT